MPVKATPMREKNLLDSNKITIFGFSTTTVQNVENTDAKKL